MKNNRKNEILDEIFALNPRAYPPYTREILPLAKAYIENNLCLVLGAGVSVDSHIPQWNELILKLMTNVIQNKFNDNKKFSTKQLEILSNLMLDDSKTSPLLQMRFIKSALDIDNEKFIELVYDALYSNSINYHTDILNAIESLCCGVKGGESNKAAYIKKIITYNFDNMLEQLLKTRHITYNVIFDENGRYNPENVNIYHVHGYIPFEKGDNTSNIVFSEEDYHQMYNDVYHWSNISQLNCFRENVCLFIGCSLTDPNIRRLLDASDKKEHYAILKRINKDYNLLNEFDEDFINEYIKLNEKLTEDYYLSLGIKIIWIDKFEEIITIIHTMESTILFNEFLLNYV